MTNSFPCNRADPPPLFRDVAPTERPELFIKKLQLCTYTFDFTDPTVDLKEKEIKRVTLQELVDYINSGSGKFTEVVRFLFLFLTRLLVQLIIPSRHIYKY